MTQCEYCGNTSSEKEAYCPTCGAKLNHKPRPEAARPQPPRVEVNRPRPTYQPPPKKSNARAGIVAFIGSLVLLMFIVAISSTSSSSRSTTGTSSRASSSSSSMPAVDTAQFAAMEARFKENTGDKEAILYLSQYYLMEGELVRARLCADAFLDSGIRDDGDIYIELANVYRSAGHIQVWAQILQQGYKNTGLATVEQAFHRDFSLESAIKDDGVKKLLELMMGKSISAITWEDVLSIRAIRFEDDGTVRFSTEEPVLVNGKIENQGEYLKAMSAVTLGDSIRDYSELRVFDGMVALELAKSQVAGEKFKDLYNLEYLSLDLYSRADEFKEVPYLPNLKGLALSGSPVISLVNISGLESLEHLHLEKTNVVDISSLAGLEQLVSVGLVRNDNIVSVDALEGLTGLKELHLENYDQAHLAPLTGMTEMERLTLIKTGVKNMDFLADMEQLRYLNLQNNDSLPKLPSLAGLTGLEEIIIDCNRFDKNENLAFLSGLSSVKKASLLKCSNFSPVRTMSQVEDLTLTFYSYGDFAPLAGATNLKRLSVSVAFGGTGHGITDISALAGLTGLEYLSLNELGGYLKGATSIFNLENLKYLNLNKATFVGDFSGITRLTNLETLRIDKVRFIGNVWDEYDGIFTNTYVTGEKTIQDYLEAIGQVTSLQSLSISDNKLENLDFLSGLTNLQYLYAADNYITTVAPLQGLEKLSYVDLSGNPVSDWSALSSNTGLTLVGR